MINTPEADSPQSEKPWMSRDYERGKVFVMPVEYVVDHLDDHTKSYMDLSKPDDKEVRLTAKIDSGGDPIQDYPPISLSLDTDTELFYLDNAITRLRYCLRNKVSHIKVKLT